MRRIRKPMNQIYYHLLTNNGKKLKLQTNGLSTLSLVT